jgi:hypothetical protein
VPEVVRRQQLRVLVVQVVMVLSDVEEEVVESVVTRLQVPEEEVVMVL